jgi:hypothetical protein
MYDALAVGFAAVADAGDFDEVAEEDAVVLGTKPVERRIDALKAADVAFLRFQEAGQRAKDLNGDGLRDGAEFGLGLICEGDALSHSCVGR